MTPLALTLGITDAEVNALAMAVRRLLGPAGYTPAALTADNLPVLSGILTLLRRFASESDGGIVGRVLADVAAMCTHEETNFSPFLVASGGQGPNAWLESPWCPFCGRYAVG